MRDARSCRKLGGFKAHLMVALADNAVTGTRNRHLCCLKGGVVGRGERAVGREPGNSGVVKVSLDDRPKVIKLLFAGLVSPDAI